MTQSPPPYVATSLTEEFPAAQQSNIDKTLEERGNRYGEFDSHAAITQNLKITMVHSPQWDNLSDAHKEALEMIAHKIGRILNGDPNYDDSWIDIQGYAKLGEAACVDKINEAAVLAAFAAGGGEPIDDDTIIPAVLRKQAPEFDTHLTHTNHPTLGTAIPVNIPLRITYACEDGTVNHCVSRVILADVHEPATFVDCTNSTRNISFLTDWSIAEEI